MLHTVVGIQSCSIQSCHHFFHWFLVSGLRSIANTFYLYNLNMLRLLYFRVSPLHQLMLILCCFLCSVLFMFIYVVCRVLLMCNYVLITIYICSSFLLFHSDFNNIWMKCAMVFMYVIYLCTTCSFSNIFHSVKMLNAKIYIYEQYILCKRNTKYIKTYTIYNQCSIIYKNHHDTGTGYTDIDYYWPIGLNNALEMNSIIIQVLWQI